MKQSIKCMLILLAALSITACSPGRGEEETGLPDTGKTQEDAGNKREDSGDKETESGMKTEAPTSEAPENKEWEQFCGSYFKAGDFRYRLSVIPGEAEERDNLSITVYKRSMEGADAERSNAVTGLAEYQLPYEAGVDTYNLEDEMSGGGGNFCLLSLNRDGTVSLGGDGEDAGIYYSYNDNLKLPEGFRRPLNDTDLLGMSREDLRIIRNQFYAVYGRKFQSADLIEYFEAEPWYRGNTEAGQFDEAILGGLIKRNIAFLNDAEEKYDAGQAAMAKKEYDALEPAPYLELLPEYGEIEVELASDKEHAVDKGLYYAAEGTISVPITLTAEQYKALDGGAELELVTDELTGEKKTLKTAETPEYGEYVFGDEAEGDYVMSTYNPDSGLYSFWANSADTRFKRVYQGVVYVLKGACEEYYGYFDMPRESIVESPGNYRVMDFNEEGPYGPQPYYGNILERDSKGYVKAIYFQGD